MPKGTFTHNSELIAQSSMDLILLPHAGFFDSVEPLDSALERAFTLFAPAPALSASLPSFLMWQDEFRYALAMKDGICFVLAHYDKYVYLPLAPNPFTQRALQAAFDYLGQVNGPGKGVSRVEGLTGEEAKRAEDWGFPVRPTLTEYVYDREKAAGLHGDPYRAKRAEVNHLLKEHAVLMRPYRKKDLSACGELYELWKSQRRGALKGGMGEGMLLSAQKAHLRALLEGENWGMDAWVVMVGDRLAAYSVGASLSPDTYGVYLEVTDLTVKGLSAYIFTNVCRQVAPHTYVNTGDAEGLPHLAESKEHWHPSRRLLLHAADPR
jgi:hypothetical protein